MKLVIDIPQTMIDELKDGCFGVKHNIYELAGLVMNGTILEQEPKTEWIPIDERLPEINEEAYSKAVLLLRRETEWDIDECCEMHITAIGYYDMYAISSDGVYLDTEGWVLNNQRTLPISDVIAWMPLPKQPYQKG